jgi:hypothetical protein
LASVDFSCPIAAIYEDVLGLNWSNHSLISINLNFLPLM